jgi:membrane-associated phospholipid phosphatase
MKQAIYRFDSIVGNKIAQLSDGWRPIMEFFTLIGQPPFTVGIAAAVLGYGFALEKSLYMISGLIAIVTIIVSSLLKLFARRKRPVTEYVKGMLFKTYSFPSSHAAGALVSYGLAALMVSVRWPEYALVGWIIALGATLLVSMSRVYLGAHYASDIIGGWIAGGIGLVFILVEFAQR